MWKMCVRIAMPLVYVVFQVFRLFALYMFASFMVNCTVYHSESSVDCRTNFTIKHAMITTPGCDPYCWKGLWIACSIVTSLLMLLALCIPSIYTVSIRPASNGHIFRSLLLKQYFWYLVFILVLVMLYDFLVESQSMPVESSKVEAGVIVSKILTACLIFQLNFTYPPSRQHFHPYSLIAMYYMSLFVFVLDYLCKFVELSIRVTYKLYTVNAINESKMQTEILILMLEVVDASLYHHYLSFFWNKIFRGKSDVLMVYSPDLAQSLEGRDGYGATVTPTAETF